MIQINNHRNPLGSHWNPRAIVWYHQVRLFILINQYILVMNSKLECKNIDLQVHVFKRNKKQKNVFNFYFLSHNDSTMSDPQQWLITLNYPDFVNMCHKSAF